MQYTLNNVEHDFSDNPKGRLILAAISRSEESVRDMKLDILVKEAGTRELHKLIQSMIEPSESQQQQLDTPTE
jgi:hypothetical protein